MSKIQKRIVFPLTIVLLLSMLLISTPTALAAEPFTLIGELDITDGVYSVGTQAFVLDPDAVCTNAAGATMDCADLEDEMLVEVKGTFEGTVYTATAVAVLSEYEGALKDLDPLTVDDKVFTTDDDTVFPPFYAVGDKVKVIYKVVDTDNLALKIVLIASHLDSRYTYKGTLTAFDDTTWTVGDYVFNMTEVELPIHFGVGDVVTLEFRIGEDMVFYATKILELETYIPYKTESSRCEVVRDHPGVQKVADEVGTDYEMIWNLFCKGFGLGEIRLAYRHAEGSEYTPEMLLALRAQGYGWGELKKMAKDNPAPEDSGEGADEAANPGNGKNKPKGNPPGLENNPILNSKPENAPGNSENAPGHNKDKDNNGKGKNK